ncbi:MAG: helix-turn-helix domain-containing protein, partial [Thermoanaerobaculia bacterium]|nr:helix-turn-helix domain-containing protein [Thermoanaerobaculia bacterium]
MTNQRIEDREPPGEGAGPARRPRGSLGTWLRAQREARGVSLREIADDSKISLRYLEALEADRFAVLPAPVFTRGFLREYARIVGLDGDEVVNLYLQVAPPREPESGESPLAPPASASLRRSGEGRGLGPVLLVTLLLLAGLVALLVWWLRREAPPAGPAARLPTAAGSAS